MIELLRPWVFLLLPLPFLTWRFLPQLSPQAVLLVPEGVRALLFSLTSDSRGVAGQSWFLNGFRIVGWFSVLLALAGPYTRGAVLEVPTGRDLVVALDLSSSMDEVDMVLDGDPVPRYQVVRNLIGRFIEERRGDRVGLMAFGHEAFLIAPLTFDTGAVAEMLDELVIGLPGHRTDLGQVVGLTVQILREEPGATRVLVILSDGEDNTGELTGLDAAKMAAAHNIKIYTIGISAELNTDGAHILQTMAEVTGGVFFAAQSVRALAEITEHIDKVEPSAIDGDPEYLTRDWTMVPIAFALLMISGLAYLGARGA
jgi:Ca-activated chloride channel family protein